MKMDEMIDRIVRRGIRTLKEDDPRVFDLVVVFKNKESIHSERFIGTGAEGRQRASELLREFNADAVLSDDWNPHYMDDNYEN